MSGTDPIRRAWRESVAGAALPPIDEVREGADRLFRLVRRRNRIEYGAALIVALMFGAMAFLIPSPLARIGALLVVLGTLIVVWQLHRRASAAPPPGAEAMLPILVHQRRELARQRDALASVGLWYLLPLVPGLLLVTLGRWLSDLAAAPWEAIVSLLVSALVFGGIWALNRRAARQLQAAVEEMDALLAETE